LTSADARVRAQHIFDAAEISPVVEIGRDRLDLAAGLRGKALGQSFETLLAARHQNQIIAAPCEPVGVDRADA
jgi:hypothetical protein